MKSFYLMKNTIQNYAWGHESYIPDFLDADWPSGKPAAEMWMGSHSVAPSQILVETGCAGNGKWCGLDKLIEENPLEMLGDKVYSRFKGLPFLFKLLAAGKSLSIQAHPDEKMAQEGFKREEDAGVPLDAPFRNYKDNRHKPEIIMALTPFTAMIGFRKADYIGHVFGTLNERCGGNPIPEDLLERLCRGEDAALGPFLEFLLISKDEVISRLIDEAVKYSGEPECKWDRLAKKWLGSLMEQFPGNPGVLAPLFLNVVEIAPSEALYQPARMLHAYLEGFGVELMANSDNVLRGGLTPKNVDVPELLRVLDFRPSEPCVLRAGAGVDGEYGELGVPGEYGVPEAGDLAAKAAVEDEPAVQGESGGLAEPEAGNLDISCRYFSTPADEFVLELLELPDSGIKTSSGMEVYSCTVESSVIGSNAVIKAHSGPKVLLVLDKTLTLKSKDTGPITLRRGQSAFIPFAAGDITVSGPGRAAVAGVPS